MNSPNNKTKIAIIEFDESHSECINSQILFLKESYDITLLINEKSIENIPKTQEITTIPLSLKNKKEIKTTSKWVKSYLNQYQIQKVIFNSCERKIYYFLKLYAFNQTVSFWGILHNPLRLKKSLKQKYISLKIKGYFVLSDFIKENILNSSLTKIPIESTYLIFLNKKNEFFASSVKKTLNETWIVIPGKVESLRRDYSFLLKFDTIPSNIKFIILGNINTTEGQMFVKELNTKSYVKNFITFKKHIPDNEFFEYIEKSDFILPLIHPNNKLFNKYLNYKITATYNWAYCFKKTLLIEEHFSKNKEFHKTSYFYNYRIQNSLFKLIQNDKKKYHDLNWNFEYQKNKYLDFINKTS